jgi:Na+-driven multidrug efflux pump
MFHPFGLFAGLFGLGVVGLAAASALAALVYPVFVIWMVVDGILRTDAEYPGTGPNRKVLWVVLMVVFHPVALVYLFVVFLKVKRGSRAAATNATHAAYTAVAPPAAQV